MPKREKMSDMVEREMVFLSGFEHIIKKNSRVYALELLKEWSTQSVGRNKYAAGCFYINNFALPGLNGADCSNRSIPRWVDEALFHPVCEPTNIPEFLKLFGSNYVDCFRLKHNGTMIEQIYEKDLEVLDWNFIIEDNKQNARETFFCPNPIDGMTLSDSHVRRLDCNVITPTVVFADFDGSDKMMQELTLAMYEEPAIIVESKNGFHAYWPIEGDICIEDWRLIQETMIKNFGSDKSIKNPSRLLRLPFSYHMKDKEDPYLVTIKSFNWRRFTRDELFKIFNVTRPEPKHQRTYVLDPDTPKNIRMPDMSTLGAGSRHPTLMSEAGRMYKGAKPEQASAIRQMLMVWYNSVCHPKKGNEEKEVNDVADWAERKEFGSKIS